MQSERPESDLDPWRFQDEILPQVSRTFALTIPELPAELGLAVGNAYLLCRIADTIEDDAKLACEDKQRFHIEFTRVVDTLAGAAEFAARLAPRLASSTSQAERHLVEHTAQVIAVTAALSPRQRTAIARCVRVMCEGMPIFERTASSAGVPTQQHLDRYCYFVAGVVGEMLAELFCDHDPAINRQAANLQRLSVSFGQGLQMTNILKDIWEDHARGVCWLPAEVFARHGFDLADLANGSSPTFVNGLTELIGLAHGHLRNALEFTLLIPGQQTGIRRFCLWSIGLALLTLRKIQLNPTFTHSAQIKVSRRAVKATIVTTNLALANDDRLRYLFRMMSARFPAPPPMRETGA